MSRAGQRLSHDPHPALHSTMATHNHTGGRGGGREGQGDRERRRTETERQRECNLELHRERRGEFHASRRVNMWDRKHER